MLNKEYRKKWRNKNLEHCREYARQWYRDNTECYHEYSRRTKEKYGKSYYLRKYATVESRITRMEKKKLYEKTYRNKLLSLLGNRCSNPNCLVPNRCRDIRCLQIDHINGGGTKENRTIGIATMIRYYVKHQNEAKQKLQILCANCNWIKVYEKGEVRKILSI